MTSEHFKRITQYCIVSFMTYFASRSQTDVDVLVSLLSLLSFVHNFRNRDNILEPFWINRCHRLVVFFFCFAVSLFHQFPDAIVCLHFFAYLRHRFPTADSMFSDRSFFCFLFFDGLMVSGVFISFFVPNNAKACIASLLTL